MLIVYYIGRNRIEILLGFKINIFCVFIDWNYRIKIRGITRELRENGEQKFI